MSPFVLWGLLIIYLYIVVWWLVTRVISDFKEFTITCKGLLAIPQGLLVFQRGGGRSGGAMWLVRWRSRTTDTRLR